MEDLSRRYLTRLWEGVMSNAVVRVSSGVDWRWSSG